MFVSHLLQMLSLKKNFQYAVPAISMLFANIAAFSQKKPIYPDSLTLYQKANAFQFVNYTPKNGKDGKDVGLLVEAVSLGALNKNGKDGKDGPALKIMTGKIALFEQQYLQLIILNPLTNLADTFYVNPYKGQIKIVADGSDGGTEGKSEKGHKGEKGKAGKGGTIEVMLDSSAAGFIRCRCLLFSNKKGAGSNTIQSESDEIMLANGQVLRPFDPPVKWTIIK
jgi:hypothetical protein